ncbi:MAG: hypothetical protein IT349_16090 [Candidatus Eisenbacteria bacterium]|nr:hypothetical protein [Candidatus Eisenbacteria bacterium]MCC7143621.1 hypothetical protein [Candidatus Eisenbacteria bacterium]
MIGCDFNTDLLLEFAVGEIAQPERSEVEAHINGCAICRAEVRLHRSLARDLKDLPAPAFPSDLEEVLVRAAIQTRRSMPRSASRVRASRPTVAWLPVLCGAAGLAIVGVLILLLLPGRMLSPGSVDEMVYGGAGRGTNVMGDALMLLRNLRQGWEFVLRVLGWLSPISRALGAVFEAVGAARWLMGLATTAVAVLAVRRLTRSRRQQPQAKVHGV